MNQLTLPVVTPEADGAVAPCPHDELLPELFAGSARTHAMRPALAFDGEVLSYAALDAEADRVARALRAKGIGKGAFVGLWMERSAALHVALLGILKAGAAYLPFDADAPAERVAVCLKDCGAAALLVDADTATRAGAQPAPVLTFAALCAEAGATPAIDLRAEGVGPTDPAYVIYTSGTTGTPKGVVISHRNVCHFLRAAQAVYGLDSADVVFQGGSVAFDLSVEEIFLPYLAGAKLWVASRQILRETDRLAAVMTAAGITVLDTVPTLLAMLTETVPSLRLILVGGEACPAQLVERWATDSRRLINTYGPTETTVVATAIELKPGEPVTIGRPLPGYTTYVVDDSLRRLPPGEDGELLIGGPAVAAGYLNRPALTAEKFIANPFDADGRAPFLYRTGDAVSVDEQGRLVFKGRIDDQVKIRGFRVELGEIEARLGQCPGIAHAAVVMRRQDETDMLVAFVVAEPGAAPEPAALRQMLAANLPAYMVPAHFEPIAMLPRLISGKLDRKRLATLPLTAAIDAMAQEEPRSAGEATLLAAARQVFPGQAIGFDADFFLDLGGHSLIAARFVSLLRQCPDYAEVTLKDVYDQRSLRKLAALLDRRLVDGKAPPIAPFAPPPRLRRCLCGLAQALVLPFILGLTTAPWLGVFVAYELLSGEEHNFIREVWALLVTYAGINLGISLIAISGKWLVIGRTRPGVYPLWGLYYFRWWLARQFTGMVHMNWFRATPIMRLALRVLGARIGDAAIIGDLDAGALDLVTVGRETSTGSRVQINNAEIIGDTLVIGRVSIGADVAIGSSCVIGRDVAIGDGAELGDLTAVGAGQTIGAWERWEGSPARKIGDLDPAALPPSSAAGVLRRTSQAVFYGVMLVLLPPVALIPIIPAFYLVDSLYDWLGDLLSINPNYVLPVMTWPAAMVLILATTLLISAMRWVVLPVVKEGRYSVHSWFYFRKWMIALATELTLETLASLYATVYMRSWFRLMGAKIGKDSEISTNFAGAYDLVEIGDKGFIADEVVMGDEDIRRGWMTLKRIRTGNRVFVGNSAVVPPGADIPDGTLIGIKSRPPSDNAQMTENSVWFGSPPIALPARQQFGDVNAVWTYEPSQKKRIARAVFEAFSVSLPSTLAITFGGIAVEFLAPAISARNYGHVLPIFMVASIGISLALGFSAVAVKWLMMGRYRPTRQPMWSWWALRTEAVAVNYWGMAGKELLDHLRGTPFLPWMLRLFGCKFGEGVYMDGTDITEFDCIEVEDFAVINSGAVLQTHLYEDRVMKIGRIKIGRGATLEGGTTVLYDTKVGAFARIGPLTIVMKGEEIPPASHWQGSPAQPVL